MLFGVPSSLGNKSGKNLSSPIAKNIKSSKFSDVEDGDTLDVRFFQLIIHYNYIILNIALILKLLNNINIFYPIQSLDS